MLAFVDDLYIVANCLAEAQVMTNELISALRDVGLRPKISKVNWISDNFDQATANGERLWIGDSPIKPSKNLKVLGSMISSDGTEREAYLHRSQMAWRTYHCWKHVLEARVDITARLRVFKATVLKSLTWGLETTRHTGDNDRIVTTTQRNMVRRMIKSKRRPIAFDFVDKPIYETWLQWQIRTMGLAIEAVNKNDCCVAQYLSNARSAWAAHIGRFGTGAREQHRAKTILLWRNLGWWKIQKRYNKIGISPCKHSTPGKLRRFEESLTINWLMECLESH